MALLQQSFDTGGGAGCAAGVQDDSIVCLHLGNIHAKGRIMTEEKARQMLAEIFEGSSRKARRSSVKPGVLLVPGLNMHHSAMGQFEALCRAEGAHVRTVELVFAGRCGSLIQNWLMATANAWDMLSRECSSVSIAGYSLGALLALYLTAILPDDSSRPGRLLLLAPPLETTLPVSLLRPLTCIPGIVFPSLAPAGIRSRRITTGAAYRAFYRMRRLAMGALPFVRVVPTEVVLAERDELVDCCRVSRLIRHSGVQTTILSRDGSGDGAAHLFSSPRFAGTGWQQLQAAFARLIHFS